DRVRHARRAHCRAGAPHPAATARAGQGIVQEAVFAKDGTELSRIVLAHIDRSPADVPIGDIDRLLQRGSFVSFDGWWGTGEPHPVRSYAATREQNIDRVVSLLERGYEDQVLLSNGSVAFTDCLPSTFVGEYAPYT